MLRVSSPCPFLRTLARTSGPGQTYELSMDMSPAVHGKSGLSFSSDLGDHQLRPRCYRSPNFDHPLRVSNGEVRQGLESRTPRRAVLEGHGTGELCPLSTPSVARIQRERYIFCFFPIHSSSPPGRGSRSILCSARLLFVVSFVAGFFRTHSGLDAETRCAGIRLPARERVRFARLGA